MKKYLNALQLWANRRYWQSESSTEDKKGAKEAEYTPWIMGNTGVHKRTVPEHGRQVTPLQRVIADITELLKIVIYIVIVSAFVKAAINLV